MKLYCSVVLVIIALLHHFITNSILNLISFSRFDSFLVYLRIMLQMFSVPKSIFFKNFHKSSLDCMSNMYFFKHQISMLNTTIRISVIFFEIINKISNNGVLKHNIFLWSLIGPDCAGWTQNSLLFWIDISYISSGEKRCETEWDGE